MCAQTYARFNQLMAILNGGETTHARKVAIIGAGSIGTGLAVVYSHAGHTVSIFDAAPAQRQRVLQEVRRILYDLQEFGLVALPADEIVRKVQVVDNLNDAVSSAEFIHECAPEDLGIKRRIMKELDEVAPANAVIASASSAITASEFADRLPGRARCLVAHPGNPPYLLRVMEIVPAAFTSEDAVRRALSFMASAELAPIRVRRELNGFVFNRLQGAVLREAYCLVRDGVASVEEIDRLVRDGLGLRWSVIGPFETVDLNTRGGIGRHARILGPSYHAMGAERGQDDPWTQGLVSEIESQRRAIMPLDQWDDRVRWRNRKLMSLIAARESEPD
ncbi:MAG: 3-hydroxyacyl-CoA dehydrogenase [Gammaproteobacteria bacterium]|nr:3-hydroxyacyl-CoA dehydrogenase [Gammaproteobacteria bacterium]